MIVLQDDQIAVVEGDGLRWLRKLGPFDHAITDPPYSDRVSKGARSSSGRELAPWALSERGFRRVVAALGANVARWIVLTSDYQHAAAIERHPPEGVRALRIGVWVKPNSAPQFTGDRPAQGWEAVLVCHSARNAPRWNGGGDRAVWTYATARGEHPNEKPIGLVRQWIEQFTDPGDRIVDPFAGSGVVGQAALELGRRCVLIEKSTENVNLILRRLGRTRNRAKQQGFDWSVGGGGAQQA